MAVSPLLREHVAFLQAQSSEMCKGGAGPAPGNPACEAASKRLKGEWLYPGALSASLLPPFYFWACPVYCLLLS